MPYDPLRTTLGDLLRLRRELEQGLKQNVPLAFGESSEPLTQKRLTTTTLNGRELVHEQFCAAHADGWSITAIARAAGVPEAEVRKIVKHAQN